MTRYEYIQSCSLEEMAHILCDILDVSLIDSDIRPCDVCIATKYCKVGHNGFKDWLSKEAVLRKRGDGQEFEVDFCEV